jgi:hypothetical protein
MNEQESTRRAQFELLALRLEVHGPEAATAAAVRDLRSGPLALQVRNLLRSHGFTRTEIAELMGEAHPSGCACWRCVIALNKAVRNFAARCEKRHTAARRKR